MCASLIPSCLSTSTVLKEMNNLPRLPQIFISNWAEAFYCCNWFYPAANSSPRGWKWVAAVSSSDGWLQLKFDLILQLTQIPAAGYELRLILSCGWLEFRWLDTSCGWLRPTTDGSSGSWIWVTADSVLQLTQVLVAGYDLRLILSCGWLRFAADSILRLTRVPPAWLDLRLTNS